MVQNVKTMVRISRHCTLISAVLLIVTFCSDKMNAQQAAHIFIGDSTKLESIAGGQPVKVHFIYKDVPVDVEPILEVMRVDRTGKVTSNRYKVLLKKDWIKSNSLYQYVFDIGNYDSDDNLVLSLFVSGDLLTRENMKVRSGTFSLRGSYLGTERLGIAPGLSLLIRLRRFKLPAFHLDVAFGASISATFQDKPFSAEDVLVDGKNPDDGKPRFWLVGFSLEAEETFDVIVGVAVWDRRVNRKGYKRNMAWIGYGGSVDLRFFKEIVGLLSGGVI